MTVLSPETLMKILGLNISDVDCGGMKLHLDSVFSIESFGKLSKNGKELPRYRELSCNKDGFYFLEPGAYKIRYMEIVKVPTNMIAIALPRSTLLRMGATIYTAVWDPGYEGRGEGLMAVFNRNGIYVEKGAQIAQLVFISMDRVTSFIYRGSYYRENI